MENILTQIDQWAVTDPNRVCYDYLGHSYTYGQLKEKSDNLAAALEKMELPQHAPLLIFGGQDFNVLVTFLASVKSGHAYIPVDIHSPLSRIQIINEIATPAAIINLSDSKLNITADRVLDKAEILALMAQKGQISPENFVHDEETFYIIFTSGTTGKPKGVQISANNLQSFLTWMQTDFGLEEGENFLAQAPYSFDLSVMSLYPSLTTGSKLSVLPPEVTNNFKELFTRLPKLALSTWVSTPSFMEICLLQPTFNAQNLPSLKHFIFCGEELTKKTAQELKTRFPTSHIFNTYGPTEATVAVSQVELSQQIFDQYTRLPIGYVKDDCQVVLVDEDLNEVQPGQQGEILIQGPGLSKCYLNNPEKTKQAFIDFQGKRAYRTGDLGSMTDDGLLLYGGRVDFQVKMHGFRIELEDVDHHLNRVKLISQAITIPKYDKNKKVTQLIAYVVVKENDYPSNLALAKAIKEEMATFTMEYMIPQRFVFVDSLPLSVNGKIDRKKLIAEVNHD